MAIPVMLRGDTSRPIRLSLAGGYDYGGCALLAEFCGARREFAGLASGGTVEMAFTADETAGFPLGTSRIALSLRNAAGEVRSLPWAKAKVTDAPGEVYDAEVSVDPGALDVADLTAADSLGAVKTRLNAVMAFLRGRAGAACLAAFAALSAAASVEPLYTTPNEMPGDARVMTNAAEYVAAKMAEAGRVRSVNGKTGEVEIVAADVGALKSFVDWGENVSWGWNASATGGLMNLAIGPYSFVDGGQQNVAIGGGIVEGGGSYSAALFDAAVIDADKAIAVGEGATATNDYAYVLSPVALYKSHGPDTYNIWQGDLTKVYFGDRSLAAWISTLAPVPTWDTLSGKPTFATVATSGAYSDLSGKPTTLSGYGITDALKADFSTLTNNAAFTSAVAAVSPPVDLSGYCTTGEAAGIASNVVSQAYIRQKLGVYLYVGEDGGIYVHTEE